MNRRKRTDYMLDNIRINGDRMVYTCIKFCFGRRPVTANENLTRRSA